MASNWTLQDLTIFKENVNTRLREWIQNLSSIEVDEALDNLELHTNGTLFERANRLLRRLHGNYTAEDFVQDCNSKEDLDRRDDLCFTFVQSSKFPVDLRNDVLSVIEAEEALENSIQANAQLPSSSPQERKKDEDMSLTMTVDSRLHMREDLISFEAPQVSVFHNTNTPNSLAPSHVATAAVTTTITSVPTCAHYSRSAGASVTMTSVTPQSMSSTSEKTHVSFVRTTLPNGEIQLIPATVATELRRAWMAERELQNNQIEMNNYISEQLEKNQSLSSKVANLEELITDLQKQLKNVVSNAQQQAAEDAYRNKVNRSAKSVQFQDTFDLNYYDISGQHDKSNFNDNKPINAHAPMFHSTAKAYCPSAPISAPASLPRTSGVGVRHNPHIILPNAPIFNQPVCSSWDGGIWPQTTKNSLSQPNPPVTHSTMGVTPSGTWNNPDTFRPRTKNLGKTVREWKLKFSGDKGVSIEEFLEQVEENRRLDNISDEELLDSMVPMFEKPALFWYRTLRPSWQTYQDFKRAALNNYSRTKRNKRSLMVEAHLRTQGADEPVRDYIVSLLTILSRFDQPWDPQDQVNLVIDNMLPKLKKKMKIYRGKLTNTQELLDKAQEAEDDEDGQWRPPPPAEQSMLPETAYRPANKAAKGKPVGVASLDAKPTSLSETELEKLFEKLFQKKAQELSSPSCKTSAKNSSENKAPSTDAETSPKPGTSDSNRASARGGGRGRGRRGRGGWQGGNRSEEIKPKSDKNKDKAAGPDGDKVLCWNCSWPGYTKFTCPECAKEVPKNEKESE